MTSPSDSDPRRPGRAAAGQGTARPAGKDAARPAGKGAARPIVVSVEQALSLPYATQRFVQLGWRVIRVEATPQPGRKTRGDPNRSIGRPAGGPERRAYFIAPNAGKEAIALDLKSEEGRGVLRRILRELPADVFCTNTLPSRHDSLGIGSDTLTRERPELIWCGISALGPGHPAVPGYDPQLQAWCGYMDLTGQREGPPMQCGLPIIDLKAGDEVFAQVALALWERERTGRGKRIHVSMARAAVSWLPTFLPLLDMGSPPGELRRNGNEHRQFIPVNAYPTADGYLYLAVGSDAQWARLVARPCFRSLDREGWRTNEGRRAERGVVHGEIAAICLTMPARAVAEELREAGVPHAPITPLEEVFDLPFVRDAVLRTTAPDGRAIRLPPAAVPTEHLEEQGGELPFAPDYGEHTDAVLGEVGLAAGEIERLHREGIIA